MNMQLDDGQSVGDVEPAVMDLFWVDAFKPKICHEKDILVIAFLATHPETAEDLRRHIALSPANTVSVEASLNPDQDEFYIVIVEIDRHDEMFNELGILLDHMQPLTQIENWYFKPFDYDEYFEWNEENFTETVPQNPEAFDEQQVEVFVTAEPDEDKLDGDETETYAYNEPDSDSVPGDFAAFSRSLNKELRKQFSHLVKINQRLLHKFDKMKTDYQYLHRQLNLYQKREKLALMRERQDLQRIRRLEGQLSMLAYTNTNQHEVVITEANGAGRALSESASASLESSVSVDDAHQSRVAVDTEDASDQVGLPPEQQTDLESGVETLGGDDEQADALAGPESGDFESGDDDVFDLEHPVEIVEPPETVAESEGNDIHSESNKNGSPAAPAEEHDAAEDAAGAISTETTLPEDPQSSFALGMAALKQKHYDAAIDYFSRIDEDSEEAPRGFYNLAVLYYMRKNFEAAIHYAEIAFAGGVLSAEQILEFSRSKQEEFLQLQSKQENADHPASESVTSDDYQYVSSDQQKTVVEPTENNAQIIVQEKVDVFETELETDEIPVELTQPVAIDTTEPFDVNVAGLDSSNDAAPSSAAVRQVIPEIEDIPATSEPADEVLASDVQTEFEGSAEQSVGAVGLDSGSSDAALDAANEAEIDEQRTGTGSETDLDAYYFALGQAALEKGDMATAIDYFSAVEQNAPEAPTCHYYLAILYMRSNQYEKANLQAIKARDMGVVRAQQIVDRIAQRQEKKQDQNKVDTEIATPNEKRSEPTDQSRPDRTIAEDDPTQPVAKSNTASVADEEKQPAKDRDQAIQTATEPDGSQAIAAEQHPDVEVVLPVIDELAPVVEAELSVVEAESSVVEAEPSVVEEEPSVVEEAQSVVDSEPSVVEEAPSVVEADPSIVEEYLPVKDLAEEEIDQDIIDLGDENSDTAEIKPSELPFVSDIESINYGAVPEPVDDYSETAGVDVDMPAAESSVDLKDTEEGAEPFDEPSDTEAHDEPDAVEEEASFADVYAELVGSDEEDSNITSIEPGPVPDKAEIIDTSISSVEVEKSSSADEIRSKAPDEDMPSVVAGVPGFDEQTQILQGNDFETDTSIELSPKLPKEDVAADMIGVPDMVGEAIGDADTDRSVKKDDGQTAFSGEQFDFESVQDLPSPADEQVSEPTSGTSAAGVEKDSAQDEKTGEIKTGMTLQDAIPADDRTAEQETGMAEEPSAGPDYYALGKRALAQKDYPLAIKHMSAIDNKAPKAPKAHYILGVLHYRLKRPEEAASHAQLALDMGISKARSLLNKIRDEMLLVVAAKKAARVEKSTPSKETPAVELTGKPEAAVDRAEKAAVDKKEAKAALVEPAADEPVTEPPAVGKEKSSDDSAFLISGEESSGGLPEFPELSGDLVDSYLDQFQDSPLDEGFEVTQTFVASDAHDFFDDEQSDDTDGDTTFDALTENSKIDSEPIPEATQEPQVDYFALGLADIEQKKFSDALENLNRAKSQHPDEPKIDYSLAVTCLRMKNYEDAHQYAQVAYRGGVKAARKVLDKIKMLKARADKKAKKTAPIKRTEKDSAAAAFAPEKDMMPVDLTAEADISESNDITDTVTQGMNDSIVWGPEDFDGEAVYPEDTLSGTEDNSIDQGEVMVFDSEAEQQDLDDTDDGSNGAAGDFDLEATDFDMSPPPVHLPGSGNQDEVKKFLSLGQKAVDKKDYLRAIKHFTKITELLPDDPLGYYNLAIISYRLNYYTTAKAHAEKALDLGLLASKKILKKIESKQT